MNPLPQDQYVNELLTGVSVGYLQDKSNFAAFAAAPVVPVELQTSIFPVYSKDDWMRIKMRVRADGDVAAEGGYKTDNTHTYHCDAWALRKAITAQAAANTRSPYNNDRDATLWLTQQGMLNREFQFAQKALATGKWTGQPDQAGVAGTPGANEFLRWDDPGSTPIQDIRRAKSNIGRMTGKEPNELVLGNDVWTGLQDHPDFVDRLKYTSSDSVSLDLVARLLELRRVTVSKAAMTTAADGVAVTSSNAQYIAGKNALLLFVEDAPGPMNPSAVHTFSWTRYLAGGEGGLQISKYYVQERKTDYVEAEQAFAIQIVAPDLGAFFSACTS